MNGKTINLTLFISTVFLSVLLSSCEQKVFKNIKYDGYLYDTIGGAPLQGITIFLSACQTGNGDRNSTCHCDWFTIGTSVTNADGSFHIEGKAARNPIYFVAISSNATFNDKHRCVSESVLKGEFRILYLK